MKCCFQLHIPDSKTPMKATDPDDENLTVGDGHNKVTKCNLIFLY